MNELLVLILIFNCVLPQSISFDKYNNDLDSLSNNEKLVVDYNKEFGALKEIEIEIEKIEKNKLNLDKQSDYNNYLLKEFEGLKLEDLNLNNLKEQVKELDNIEETLTISANIINEINNDEIGVNDKLSLYVREINKISELKT